jgi:hypothetical protein
VNHQTDFNSRTYIAGTNNRSSLMTEFTNILNDNKIDPSQVNDKYPFDIGLAYNPNNNGLIYYNDSTKKYYSDAPNGGVYQEKTISTQGSMNEFSLAMGINVDDKLYIGATIGIPSIYYSETSLYRESKVDTSIKYFQNMNYQQFVETRGTGVNFKAGLIYRPANWVRIGAAIHTPTYYPSMHDHWYSSMSASFDNNGSDASSSPDGYFNYELTTPFRAIGSVAFMIGSYGLISGDYEYVNYSQARFYSGSDSFSSVDSTIQKSFTAPLNFRIGTEWRIQNFRIRGGFGYNGKPYKSSLYNGEKFTVSGGFGYRGKHFYSDIAYVWSRVKDNYYLYDPTLVDPSMNTTVTTNVVLTFGVRF